MRSFFATLRSLVLPSGAGPNDPRRFIGPDIPTEIQTFYAGRGEQVVSVDIWYQTSTNYLFWALVQTLGLNATQDFGGFRAGTIRITKRTTNAVLWPTEQWGGIGFATLDFQPAAEIRIDNVLMGRGFRVEVDRTTDSAAIGAETVVLTLPNFTYTNQHAYEFRIRQDVVSSAAGNFTVNRLRRGTTTAGAQVALRSFPTFTANTVNDWSIELTNTSGGDITQQMVLTLNTTAGTTTQKGGTNTISTLEVWDIGAAVDFPNRAAI